MSSFKFQDFESLHYCIRLLIFEKNKANIHAVAFLGCVYFLSVVEVFEMLAAANLFLN